MSPPLRTEDDIEALLEAIVDGTVDCIVTDHAPHNPNEKMLEFDRAPFGIIGLETALGLVLTHLYHPGLISLKRVVELMSTQPAQLIHPAAGSPEGRGRCRPDPLRPGSRVGLRPRPNQVHEPQLPFHGTALKGRVAATIVAGKIVYQCPEYFKE